MNGIVDKEISREDRQKIEECYILGRLADDGLLPRLGAELEKAVAYHKDGEDRVVFYLTALSREPELLRRLLGKDNDDVYISFDNKNKRYLERVGYFNNENRVEFLREHFKGKLILFKPVLNYEMKKERYHYNFEILLVEKMESEDENYQDFLPVPVLSNSVPSTRFERKLLDEKPIELSCYNHALDVPEFIICDGYIYQIPDESVLEKYVVNSNMYICRKPEQVMRIEIPEDYERNMRMVHKEIAFISNDIRLSWIDLINDEGVSIQETEEMKKVESKEKIAGNAVTSESLVGEVLAETVTEGDFILRLDYLARKKKLRYSLENLYNFHTSLKTSNFTILGGMSGTGKTQLAMLYAEAMKMKEGDNLLFIPVKPSYTEPSDLLGFLNPQTGVYTESDVGLVSFMYEASKKPEKMYMIVFDEMNLGQVEYYFSDFLSILELENKRLRLFNKSAMCVQEHLRDGILIKDNILFVGTANFDETTRDFSNRMLDRSNVIILEKMTFGDAYKHETNENIENPNDYANQEKNEIKNPDTEITANNYNGWIVNNGRRLASLEEQELSILDKLHEEISNFDSQTGVSFRIAEQIGHYLDNIPKDENGVPFLSRGTAFDNQIKQRILSKIRGHKEQIEKLVGRYDEENGYSDGRISIVLTSGERQHCEKSIAYLEQKAKELMRNGYTL
ncbi:AAA family ATPase [Filibacter tadaridae]|uniref:AAA domain (Dynein-related subfamily) n=1 Tax=Filibacter tadaridae TaxID=2483811 RepID=A0A3P5XTK2_9BACL|nr:AAA family ATPase [Filibacter tadaridae]VDC32365.1 AAA domain (dynein-related subfamily) [Filibacter tadaridae]